MNPNTPKPQLTTQFLLAQLDANGQDPNALVSKLEGMYSSPEPAPSKEPPKESLTSVLKGIVDTPLMSPAELALAGIGTLLDVNRGIANDLFPSGPEPVSPAQELRGLISSPAPSHPNPQPIPTVQADPKTLARVKELQAEGNVASVPTIKAPAIKVTRSDLQYPSADGEGVKTLTRGQMVRMTEGEDLAIFTGREGHAMADRLEKEGKLQEALSIRAAIGKSGMDTVIYTDRLTVEASAAMGFNVEEVRKVKEYNATTPEGQALAATQSSNTAKAEMLRKKQDMVGAFMRDNFQDYDKAKELKEEYLRAGDLDGIKQTTDYIRTAEAAAEKEVNLALLDTPEMARMTSLERNAEIMNRAWEDSILRPSGEDGKAGAAAKKVKVEKAKQLITGGNNGMEVHNLDSLSTKQLGELNRVEVTVIPGAYNEDGSIDAARAYATVNSSKELAFMAGAVNGFSPAQGGNPLTINTQGAFWSRVNHADQTRELATTALLQKQPALGEAFKTSPAARAAVKQAIDNVASNNAMLRNPPNTLTSSQLDMYRDYKLQGQRALLGVAANGLGKRETEDLLEAISSAKGEDPALANIPDDLVPAYVLTYTIGRNSSEPGTTELAVKLRKMVSSYYLDLVGSRVGADADEYLRTILSPMYMYNDTAIAKPDYVVG